MEAINEMFLTDMEKDVIGEVMNISLGSSATSLSSLLSKRVDITVPRVNVVSTQEFNFNNLEPAVGVEIKFIEGITGDNILILKKADIKVILETLMGIEITDEEFELDEIAISAVCEVMNQMMGSAATALADFLGRTVNISTPIAYEITDKEDFKGRYFPDDGSLVEVKFDLKVGDVINSEFLNAFSIPLAKEMVNLFLKGTGIEQNSSNDYSSDELLNTKIEEKIPQKTEIEMSKAPVKEPKAEERRIPEEIIKPEKQSFAQPKKYEDDFEEEEERVEVRRPKKKRVPEYYEEDYDDDYDDDYEERPRRAVTERKAKRNKAPVNVVPMQYDSFDEDEEGLSEEQRTNLGLIMSVPLQVTVEIGRTKKRIKDILEFSQGTIVELDKQAGTQVDIIINGQVIAKGDVVVVNDNFGVRVTEIIKKDEIVKLTI